MVTRGIPIPDAVNNSGRDRTEGPEQIPLSLGKDKQLEFKRAATV